MPGPGDKVAQALRQVGYQVEEIDEDAIATGDLRRFDAVVMGIRAYNTRPRLLALHGPHGLRRGRRPADRPVQHQQPLQPAEGRDRPRTL
ncbi:MAG: hypothetical protein R3F43_21450 [bacterium]